MKKSIFKGKSTRTKIFTGISMLLVIILFALNLLLTYYGTQKSLFVDLTPEGLYTLTDEMKKQCDFINKLDKDVKITFCADPDVLLDSQVTRLTYFMALQMQDTFENFEVETVNVVYNPTAVAKYKVSSLSTIDPGDIIISYGDKYRIQSPLSFWRGNSEKLQSFDGEYKLATYILSVTAVNRPVAYFTSTHGETYYDPQNPERAENKAAEDLYALLTERGMEVKTLDLTAAGGVPEDCVLLVINNPQKDFLVDPERLDELSYMSEIEMLDRYLVNGGGSIMVSRDYANSVDGKSVHPAFDAFLYEWGFDFSESVVADSENHLAAADGSYTTVIGEYSPEETYGYQIYGDFAALPSAPDVIFKNSGYIKTSFVEGGASYEGNVSIERKYLTFMNSYDTASAYEIGADGEVTSTIEASGALTLAATTARRVVDSESGEESYSYIFCVNSPDFFSGELLSNSSYANYDVISLLVENMARTDRFASITLGSDSQNSTSYGGKILADTALSAEDAYENVYENGVVIKQIKVLSGVSGSEIIGFSVALLILPLAAVGAGIAVFVRRRFL